MAETIQGSVEQATWETENSKNIIKWTAEWDVKPDYKIVTFTLKDKTTKVFEYKEEPPQFKINL